VKFFNKKKIDNKTQGVLDFFKIEKTDKETLFLGDFANKDFSNWLMFIHGIIQDVMKKKMINGKNIENYVNLSMYIGGQRVDITLIKDGKKSPHELLQELKTEGKE
jgi:hypothetical protein